MSRHVLDENIRRSQAQLIRQQIASVAQVGVDWGRKGWDDLEQIIPHLHSTEATFHTQDSDYFNWRWCHRSYCLVYYDVPSDEIADWLVRFLRHPQFDTHAKRLGKVIRVHPEKIAFFQIHQHQIQIVDW